MLRYALEGLGVCSSLGFGCGLAATIAREDVLECTLLKLECPSIISAAPEESKISVGLTDVKA